MNVIGIGLKLGMAGTGAGSLGTSSDGRGLEGEVDARRGLHLAIPLSVGGNGFGWTLEPYMSRSSIGRTTRDLMGAVTGREPVDLTAYGVYTGPVVQIHVANPLYVGVGLGVKGAYVANDGFDYAFDAYARVPLSVTYYVIDQLAVVAEFGLGYGISIFADQPRIRIDPVTNRPRTVPTSPQVGKSFAWDWSIGVRLP